MTNEQTVLISMNIPKGLLDKLDKEADKNRRSRSAEIVFRLEKDL